MSLSRQSASAKRVPKGSRAKRSKRQAETAEDVGELILAELEARRSRLQELLRMVRREVVRELAAGTVGTPVSRPVCRRFPDASTRSGTPRRAARAT